MAALDIAREIAQLRATPGANWLAQALQKIADHVNAPVPVPPEPPAPKPVTLASLLPPGTTLLTAGSAAPGHPTGATGTLLSVPVSSGTVITDLSNPDNQGSAPVSVGLTMPSDFTVTGSPAQNNQTITVTRATEAANSVLAGPASGAAAVPSYRALVAADIPAPAGDVVGTYAATEVTGLHFGSTGVPISGTAPTSGQLLFYNGTDIAAETIVPIANGGTGTATPGLVAGANISITGSWPDQTVALVATPDTAGYIANSTGFKVWNATSAPQFWFYDSTGATSYGGLGLASAVGAYFLNAAPGDLNVRCDSGVLRLGANPGSANSTLNITQGAGGTAGPGYIELEAPAFADGSAAITAAPPSAGLNEGWKLGLFAAQYWLGIAGGTVACLTDASGFFSVFEGASYPANNRSGAAPDSNATASIGGGGSLFLQGPVRRVGGVATVGSVGCAAVFADVQLTAQTASIGTTTIFSVASAGVFRVTATVYVHSATGTSSASVTILHGYSGNNYSSTVASASLGGNGMGTGSELIACAAASAIYYSTTWTSGGAGDTYDLYIAVEQVL